MVVLDEAAQTTEPALCCALAAAAVWPAGCRVALVAAAIAVFVDTVEADLQSLDSFGTLDMSGMGLGTNVITNF